MTNDDLKPPKADFSAPPPYSEVNEQISNSRPFQQPQTVQLPPPQIIEHNGKLPTYEEVQMEKIMNDEMPMPPQGMHQMPPPPIHHSMRNTTAQSQNTGPALTFIAIDTDGEQISGDSSLLGTDIVFVTAFFVAFIFNWVGFLMLACFCHTIAARYGALSGFGLSLTKWTLIVKHSTDITHDNNGWLWWLIMAFGFLICIRALVQYLSIKKSWRLLSASAQERLLFFY